MTSSPPSFGPLRFSAGARVLAAARRFAAPVPILIAVAALAPASAWAEAYVPAGDEVILERLPAPRSAELRELSMQRKALVRDPGDLRSAVSVALAYLELGRAEADPRYDGYAQAVLAPWWELAQPPVPVLSLRAALKQRRHDFEGALVDLDRLLEREPGHTQGWLTRATILGVLGRPDETRASCARIAGSAPLLVVAACTANAAGLGGRAEQGYALLQRTLAGAGPGNGEDGDPGNRVWALTILAELALRRGDWAAAGMHFRAALALDGQDPYLLGAYADFLLDRGRAGEVVALLRGRTRIDALLLRLAIAEQAIGHPDARAHVELLDDRFAAAARRGDAVHRHEAARFMLALKRRPRAALHAALENFSVQREPRDARLVLEAALAAGLPAAARPVLEWLAQSRLDDHTIAALLRRLREAA